jgi:hypothetical protein
MFPLFQSTAEAPGREDPCSWITSFCNAKWVATTSTSEHRARAKTRAGVARIILKSPKSEGESGHPD